jgi:hypothetical protein
MFQSLQLRRCYWKAGALALASSVALLAGCSMQETASESNSLVGAATISGRIHGGQQPIAGATVDLYAVGTTGYGLGATRLATTTSANGTGAFNFTQKSTQTGADNPIDSGYGCPTNSTLLYLVASGGDPTGTGTLTNNNSNIRLLDAIGQCSAVKSSFFDVNEVSTAVSVAALQQYINPLADTNIGSPSTTLATSSMSRAVTGIANAFALVQNVLNQSAGQVNAIYAPSGGLSTATVTATPEVAKINTIADIIAACVNTTGSSSSACSTLFAAATPPPFPKTTNFPGSYSPAPTASDTLQATLFMLVNPTDSGTQVSSCSFGAATSNLACLYNAQTAAAPFVGLTAAPTDWTVGITYASAAVSPTTTVGYLQYPQYLAIDKAGDIWVTNGITGGGALLEMSPQGAILQQALATTGLLNGPHVPVIDPAGNVWVPNFGSATTTGPGYGTTVVEFPVNGTAATSANIYTVGGCPYELASDGAGDIFVGECTVAGTSTTGPTTPGSDIREILAGTSAPATASIVYTASGGYAATQYSGIAVDSTFRLWTSSGGTSIYSLASPYTTALTTVATDAEPVGIDNGNNAWVANYKSTANLGTLNELSISGGSIVNAAGSPFTPGGGLSTTEFLVLDGAGNIWVTNYTAKAGFVSETAGTNTGTNGTALSPSTGFAQHTYYGAYGVAIDPSGNVWVGNNVSYANPAILASNSGGGAAAGGFVTEIVGAAVPVVTPLAAGLPATAGGASYIGSSPK